MGLNVRAPMHSFQKERSFKMKVFLKTYGCQMNVRDSEIICGILQNAGYKICNNDKNADVVIFNTCSVRQNAEDRVWSLIGSYKGSKIIGLVGCMAQNYKELAFQRNEDIAFVVGPQDVNKIPQILEGISKNNLLQRKIWETDSSTRPEVIYHTGFYEDKKHAYAVISEGCSNFCSYCVVPYVRGPIRHRRHEEIIKEIKTAVNAGITEITLLGQNVNAYTSSSDGNINFIELLNAINSIRELRSIDFMTSHPRDASVELFKAIASLDKLKKSLHLPVQSGSDRILKLMNRGYTKELYLELVKNYRKIVKGGVLTTDIIVGFPGESESDFKDTYGLIKHIGFNSSYIFKYSPRPKTEAFNMVDDVARKEKEKRHKLVLDLQRRISNKKHVRS